MMYVKRIEWCIDCVPLVEVNFICTLLDVELDVKEGVVVLGEILIE